MGLRNTSATLLAYPFRLFFLLTGLYAIVILAGWLGFLLGHWPISVGSAPIQWHSHEMLYGFVGAAIAGFLLTAITKWTGCPPLHNKGLATLAVLWLAGRICFWLLDSLSPIVVAVADLSFWFFIFIYLVRVLILSGNQRNLPIAGIILLLTVGNGLMHWGFITHNFRLLKLGENWGLELITLLMAIIGGRIIPAFSQGWRQRNNPNGAAVQQYTWLERSALLALLLLVISSALALPPTVTAIIALSAGALHSIRLFLWRGWHCHREPLLWSLHLGYLWLVTSLWLRGLSPLLDLPPSLWQHTLAVGGMATLILAVMTRVSMGHTGRPMQLLAKAIIIYWAITAAALIRIAVAAKLLPFTTGIACAAALWIIAFALFIILYAPILSAPRADGQPG